MLSLAVLYAVLGTIGWGVSNAAAKKIVEHFGPIRGVVLRNTITVLILLVVYAIMRPPLSFDMSSLVLGLAVALFGYVPYFLFLKGLERGKVGVIYPISDGWVVITAFIGFIFLGDPFSWLKIVVLGIVVFGVLLVSLNFNDFRNSDLFSFKSGGLYAILATLMWGILFAFFATSAAALGAIFFALLVEGMVLLGALAHLLIKREPLMRDRESDMEKIRSTLNFILISGLGAGFGTMFINFGYATGAIAIVSAIAGAQVAAATIFARIAYKEKLTLQQYGGIGCVIAGVVFASLV